MNPEKAVTIILSVMFIGMAAVGITNKITQAKVQAACFDAARQVGDKEAFQRCVEM